MLALGDLDDGDKQCVIGNFVDDPLTILSDPVTFLP